MMRRTGMRGLIAMGIAGAALMAVGGTVGCSQNRAQEVRANPTPDLETLYQNDEDIKNAIARTFDENGRMFWQDLGRAFYWDRPSRLTREPVPVP